MCIHVYMDTSHQPSETGGTLPGLTATELVFRRLLDAIATGGLPSDSTVTEEQLAARHTVSRTPMRDAVRRLEALKLLVREPGRGLRVPPMTLGEMHNLSATREALEGLLAAAAATRVAAGGLSLDRLRAVHDRHARVLRTGDTELILSVGYDFHEEVRRLAGNPVAAACHEQVMLAFERYRHLARKLPARPKRIAEEHGEVLRAIAAGRPEAAERAMRRHVAAGREGYAAALARALR